MNEIERILSVKKNTSTPIMNILWQVLTNSVSGLSFVYTQKV